jgi:cellobiose-specific phosphotransferase system component IIC
VIFWFINQGVLELMQLIFTKGVTTSFVKEWASSIWNWLDLLRLSLQILYIIENLSHIRRDEDELTPLQERRDLAIFAYLTLISWICLTNYLRYFSKYRVLIEYIKQSFEAVIPFMLVTFIMLSAFSLSYQFYNHEG